MTMHSSPIQHGSPAPVHVPVLLRETLQILQLRPGLVVADGTVGAGGHARAMLEQIRPGGTLIGLDRDAAMLQIAAPRLSGPDVHLLQASYADLPRVLHELRVPSVDRILLDLGLCSDQLADDARGFSFHASGTLDLRFDPSQGEPAAALLARASEHELARIFRAYGEEPQYRACAQAIVRARQRRPIETARDLVLALPGSGPDWRPRDERARHPATRVFQALRMAVNDELAHLQRALSQGLVECLKPQGILAIISFHSLEDRMVKQALRAPRTWRSLLPKPLRASPAEQRINPRSRTARLRSAIRL